ncbi:hypothetical protein Taro_009790 [Colocasia esculenta]|uniref:Uncharacterized protein n=1 Tax=Colocasia esculenta TaxID=4460 RepID=A0A843U7G9_COLES|nr:hypothetical protein [Colocasia esculenta]
MLPSPMWHVCGLWATPGWSILWVCLSTGVATAVCVATPEEASARVAVTVRYPVATGLLSCCPSPSRWYRDGLGGRVSACVCLGCSVVSVGVSACAPGLVFPQDLQVGNAVLAVRACLGCPTALLRVRPCLVLAGLVMGYKLAVRHGSCCACLACSPSAWHLRACPVQRLSPLPGTPILGSLLRECSGLRACSSWWTLERRGKRGLDSGAESFVELSCMGRDAEVVDAGRDLVRLQCCVRLCVSVAALPRSSAEGRQKLGWRVEGVDSVSPSWLLTAVAWLLLFRAFGGFRSVSSRFCSPVLGCQSVVAPAPVASRPRGVSGVVLFVGPRPCGGTGNPYWALFARLTPLLPSSRGSSSRELSVGRVAEAAVASCVVSSSVSECCELLYLSE